MADVYKILGQVAPGDTNVTDLYEVPAAAEVQVGGGSGPVVAPKSVSQLTQTLVTSIIVCEIAGGTATFDIILQAESSDTDPPDNKEYLVKASAMTAKETKVLNFGLTLSSGNIIRVVSSIASNIAFTAMGIEVT